ncbi:hypothetical protein F3157_03405 [Virgibacillus dakarensis]|uniref:Uncharacterized protein n=1 Tax=Lentibacillus populi TaxID=1827502 RepID=A0A9W5TVS8_9BACI|nr:MULTISPECIES: hypothetical protein [Bacillaceae]MBT2217584.1 hypothetical protein [Virgibacillus dakarensis]MTW84705.1 hypothetical protein [Virgibacillus dakarensis]GGB36494.1 hypothetical protein GCM10011409_12380 [Lentibacillus populi]
MIEPDEKSTEQRAKSIERYRKSIELRAKSIEWGKVDRATAKSQLSSVEGRSSSMTTINHNKNPK